MEIMNLTPHTLHIHTGEGDVLTLPPSGIVARVEETRSFAGYLQGIPVDRVRLGNVVGLPEPEAGVMYVVAALVASALRGREDVFSPGVPVRDSAGNIIGAKGLTLR